MLAARVAKTHPERKELTRQEMQAFFFCSASSALPLCGGGRRTGRVHALGQLRAYAPHFWSGRIARDPGCALLVPRIWRLGCVLLGRRSLYLLAPGVLATRSAPMTFVATSLGGGAHKHHQANARSAALNPRHSCCAPLTRRGQCVAVAVARCSIGNGASTQHTWPRAANHSARTEGVLG